MNHDEVKVMLLMRLVAPITYAAVLGAGNTAGQTTSTGSGQPYPSRVVRIVTAEAGGGSDYGARLIAQGLTSSFGQQVIVENRGGGGGTVAALAVAKAQPDGYTLLYYSSNVWLMPYLRDNVPYDPVKDFSPITYAVSSPNILAVHPALPVKSVKELIALAKARPGELNYAANAPGSSPHLAGELFKALAKVNIVAVPYKGAASAINDFLGGQVQLMFATPSSVMAHVKSGRLRALAITSAKPSVLLPGIPPIATVGVPGYNSVAAYAVFAPAGTPTALIHRLSQEIVVVLNKADVKEKFSNAGIEVVANSPDEVTAMIKSEMAGMGKVIRDAGIRAN